jgi:hypothetical protein
LAGRAGAGSASARDLVAIADGLERLPALAQLLARADVQNIDLMNLAGFCRNCLSKWYLAAAQERGVPMTDPQAREIVYGEPYETWKARHQSEASSDQKAAFAAAPPHAGH